MKRAGLRRRLRVADAASMVGATVLVLVVSAVMVPVLAVLTKTVGSAPGLSDLGASPWSRMFSDPRTWRIVGLTVAQAAVSAVVTVAVGVPVAFVLARFTFRGSALVRAIVSVPFVLPSVVIGAAFGALFGGRGLFDARGSWWLIIAAHLCFNLAVLTRTVGAAFAQIDPDVESAARLLGRSRRRVVVEIVLPQVGPAIAAAGMIVFLFCLTSFGVIVMLGGGSVTTIEVELWTRATRQFDLSGAAVLSAIQLVAVLLTMSVDSVLARRMRSVTRRAVGRSTRPVGRSERLLVLSAVTAAVVVCGLPLGALAVSSLRVPGGYGLANWKHMGSVLQDTALQVSPAEATLNSLVFALAATLAAVLLAVPAGRFISRRSAGATQSIILLPLGVSSTTIGLGLLIAFGSPPIDLRRSGWLIPAAQMLVALPLVTRLLIAPMRSLDRSVLDAAAVLGSGPAQRFRRVELVILLPAVVAAAGLGFVACLGEFGATVFVTRSDRTTMPVLLERLMSRPGGAGYGQAMALAVLMVFLCWIVLSAAERVSSRSRLSVASI